MRRIEANKKLVKLHADSVATRIKNTYNEPEILSAVKKLGKDSIEEFIKTDIDTMRDWVLTRSEDLQFPQFKMIYNQYFSNGSQKYVHGTYNAYAFLKLHNIMVCPYCDNEYLDIIKSKGKEKRTNEIDHFFPKKKYPALAMCFYNLIPSGQICNGIKLENMIGANPYDGKIEDMTYLYPDIPVGVSMEKITPDECVVRFHPKGKMKINVDLFGLEERYKRHAPEAHRLLMNLQRYNEEKIQELSRMGLGTREEIISTIFGSQDPKEKNRALRQKMLKDLTGY